MTHGGPTTQDEWGRDSPVPLIYQYPRTDAQQRWHDYLSNSGLSKVESKLSIDVGMGESGRLSEFARRRLGNRVGISFDDGLSSSDVDALIAWADGSAAGAGNDAVEDIDDVFGRTGDGVDEASVDPSNYGMIVNADTPSGIALAPSAVRQGITADSDGTEVELSDGTTVTAYPRQESDEAVRDPSTGAPVDTPVGSGGVEGGVDGSGMIGGAVAVVLLVVAGTAALLGGGD
jgi:hypothetical protein